MKVIVAYIPVIHKGVIDFLNGHRDCFVLILGSDILDELSFDDEGIKSLKRDPRILDERLMLFLVDQLRLGQKERVRVLRMCNIKCLETVEEIIMPDEDVTRYFAKRFLSDIDPEKVKLTFEPTFLRWDMSKTLSEIPPNCDQYITEEQLPEFGINILINEVFQAANKSSDWWRQVGALMFRGGQIILTAWNHHMPHEYRPYILGDPRSNFDAGQHIELCSAGHAEATVVAVAAKQGISTRGADIIVTTFPCVPCAKLIAQAGFGRLFFVEGYSRLESVEILKEAGVEIIHIELNSIEEESEKDREIVEPAVK